MKPSYILAVTIISVCGFVACFLFLVHKPLTIGIQTDYYERKTNYLASLPSPKFVLLAGSNGRVSHRCETMEPLLGIPCVNMSISADISIDYQLDKLKPFLKAGDIVYLPLEYGALKGSKSSMMSGTELPYMMAYDHDHLVHMDWERQLQAIFYCDLKYLFGSGAEMLLQRAGVERRSGVETLTAQGDETGHVVSNGEAYRSYLTQLDWSPPTPAVVDEGSYKAGIIIDFLQWASSQGIIVIGGLPTTFDDQPVPDELIDKLRKFYESRGQHFVVMPNRSQYPREYFFDTKYHLAEEHQIAHSKMLSTYLKNFLDSRPEKN